MHGQLTTGRMLAGLAQVCTVTHYSSLDIYTTKQTNKQTNKHTLQAYVDAINNHAVPSIANAWEGVTRVECNVSVANYFHLRLCFGAFDVQDAADNASRMYSEGLAARVPAASLPLDVEALEAIHSALKVSIGCTHHSLLAL
jgi:hypothetical protein